MAEATIMNAGAYPARGMAYLAVDFPRPSAALRRDLHLPPDTKNRQGMIDFGDAPGCRRQEDRHAGYQHGRPWNARGLVVNRGLKPR
jgi:hypothetical protein